MGTGKNACAALLAACSIALVACEPSPNAPPSATPTQSQGSKSASASPSDSPSPSPSASKAYKPATAQGPAQNVPVPKKPALASKNSDDGAKSFATYYFDLINYSIETNDTIPIKEVTTHACEVCALGVIDPSDRAKNDGRWQVGGIHEYEVLTASITGKNLAVASVRYVAEPSKFYVDPNVIESESDGVESTLVALGLEYDSGWKVYKIAGDE